MCAVVTPLVLHFGGLVLNYAQERLFPVSDRGRLIVEVSRSHTHTHTQTNTRKASPERVVISSQRALPTQRTQKKKVHARNWIFFKPYMTSLLHQSMSSRSTEGFYMSAVRHRTIRQFKTQVSQ